MLGFSCLHLGSLHPRIFKILCVPVQCVPTYLIFVFDTEPRLTLLSAAEVVPVKLWPWHRLFVLFCCFSALKVEQNAETRTALLWCPDEQRSALRFLEKLWVSSPAILRSILRPIPTGILIIPVGIEN